MAEEYTIEGIVKKDEKEPDSVGNLIKGEFRETRTILSRIEKALTGNTQILKEASKASKFASKAQIVTVPTAQKTVAKGPQIQQAVKQGVSPVRHAKAIEKPVEATKSPVSDGPQKNKTAEDIPTPAKPRRDTTGRFVAKPKSAEAQEKRKQEKQDRSLAGKIGDVIKTPFAKGFELFKERGGPGESQATDAAGTAAGGPIYSALKEIYDKKDDPVVEKLSGLFKRDKELSPKKQFKLEQKLAKKQFKQELKQKKKQLIEDRKALISQWQKASDPKEKVNLEKQLIEIQHALYVGQQEQNDQLKTQQKEAKTEFKKEQKENSKLYKTIGWVKNLGAEKTANQITENTEAATVPDKLDQVNKNLEKLDKNEAKRDKKSEREERRRLRLMLRATRRGAKDGDGFGLPFFGKKGKGGGFFGKLKNLFTVGGGAAASKGGKVAGILGKVAVPFKALGKVAIPATKLLGKAIVPLTAALAAFDFGKGWNNKDLQKQAFGLQDGEEATTRQKSAAASASVIDLGGITTWIASKIKGEEVTRADLTEGIYNLSSKINELFGDPDTELKGKQLEKYGTDVQKGIKPDPAEEARRQRMKAIEEANAIWGGDSYFQKIQAEKSSKSSTPISTDPRKAYFSQLRHDPTERQNQIVEKSRHVKQARGKLDQSVKNQTAKEQQAFQAALQSLIVKMQQNSTNKAMLTELQKISKELRKEGEVPQKISNETLAAIIRERELLAN